MAIRGTFKYANENITVIIDGNNLMFLDSSGTITTLEGLRIDKTGVIKEFPDLKDDEEWKQKGLNRLKEHIKKMNTEMEILKYIKTELNKFGYEELYYQRAGFRPRKFEWMSFVDTSITILIIGSLILVVISRFTHQTIPEFIGGMIDLIREK